MTNNTSNLDPVPTSDYPTLAPAPPGGTPPSLPSAWECYALLHPFSPIQSNSTPTDKGNPFFELCIAYINYSEGEFLSAQITGISGRKWWYLINKTGTYVSTNGQTPTTPVNMGWTLPSTNWFGAESQNATCAGVSFLNWMEAQEVAWWKMPVAGTNPPAATWLWLDLTSAFPVRMMFGQGPPSPSVGDPNQLALFQMFSFTYFPRFQVLSKTSIPTSFITPHIAGFSFGNPNNYDLFTWNTNFGMTVFMTPVNEQFNPLPTRVLYVYKPDNEYKVFSDRAQNTLMLYTDNPSNPFTSQVALLTGAAPKGVTPPPNSDEGFLINFEGQEVTNCVSGKQFPFPQEPPNWVAIPAVEGTIQATVDNNSILCPDNTVTILSVLFPPSPTGTSYPDSTYLWTWYSPLNADGTSSRPVTFMQSQSGVGVGTSLALADYFYYEEFQQPIDPSNFNIPSPCMNGGRPK